MRWTLKQNNLIIWIGVRNDNDFLLKNKEFFFVSYSKKGGVLVLLALDDDGEGVVADRGWSTHPNKLQTSDDWSRFVWTPQLLLGSFLAHKGCER